VSTVEGPSGGGTPGRAQWQLGPTEVELEQYDYDYRPPVRALLSAGEPPEGEWMDYGKLGLTKADAPELLRMVTDDRLLGLAIQEEDEDTAAWAPLHALRALGQLGVVEAAVSLLQWEAECEIEDWMTTDLPTVLGMLGPEAIPPLSDVASDPAVPVYPRTHATDGLAAIANAHPDYRQACLEAIMAPLARYRDNDPLFNAFLIASLLDIKADEALPLIQEVFAADSLDQLMVDWACVKDELGLDLPDPSPSFDAVGPAHGAAPRPPKAGKAKKAKRKQARKSSRRNR
jgi:hypothetical protein